jgi:hypothetical protein
MFQNPLHARQKRLLKLTATLQGVNSSGTAGTSIAAGPAAGAASLLPLATTSLDSDGDAPEQVRELFAGIIMNDKSISQRRSPRSPRAVSHDSAEPPSLERVLADAVLTSASTDYDNEVTGYALEQHIQPFGESWVIPGRSADSQSRSRGHSPARSGIASRGFGLEQFVDEREVAEIMLTNVGHGASSQESPAPLSPKALHDGPAAENVGSLLSSLTSTNVPFASLSPRSRSPVASHTKAATPQQPATPRSSANAARLSSRINREYRQHITLQKLKHPQFTAEELAEQARKAYEQDSSDDDAPSVSAPAPAGAPGYPSMSAVSMDSMENSAWSSQFSGNRVPAISDWNRALQSGANQRTQQSQSARDPRSEMYQSSGRKFDQFGSMRSSRVIDNNSSLLAPTLSSTQRSMLTSEIARVEGPHERSFPLPQTPRTAEDIAHLRRTLYMPVVHPSGPVTRKPVVPQSDANDDSSDEGGDDRQDGLLYLPPGSSELQSTDPTDPTRLTATYAEYHAAHIPQVVLPTQIHKQRPYSSYQKISRQLVKKRDADRNSPYQGAYTHEFWNPDEQQRKEYMKSREKFVAGAFKTRIGAANTAMPIRKEGGVRGEGRYPLEPPGSVAARPEKTTAAHFASMQRSTQPPLAGAWK